MNGEPPDTIYPFREKPMTVSEWQVSLMAAPAGFLHMFRCLEASGNLELNSLPISWTGKLTNGYFYREFLYFVHPAS